MIKTEKLAALFGWFWSDLFIYTVYMFDCSQDILLSEVLKKDYLYTFSSNNL